MDLPEAVKQREGWELSAKTAGAKMFDTFDENERAACRFGMFPHKKFKDAEATLIAENPLILEVLKSKDICRLISVGAMDACNHHGGGMVV